MHEVHCVCIISEEMPYIAFHRGICVLMHHTVEQCKRKLLAPFATAVAALWIFIAMRHYHIFQHLGIRHNYCSSLLTINAMHKWCRFCPFFPREFVAALPFNLSWWIEANIISNLPAASQLFRHEWDYSKIFSLYTDECCRCCVKWSYLDMPCHCLCVSS